MAEERYYKLSFLEKTDSGATWEEIYLKSRGEIQMTNLSNYKNSKLEEISKEKYTKDINDSQHDFSYG